MVTSPKKHERLGLEFCHELPQVSPSIRKTHLDSINFVKQALSAWIVQEEERDRLTLEALADVDANRVN